MTTCVFCNVQDAHPKKVHSSLAQGPVHRGCSEQVAANRELEDRMIVASRQLADEQPVHLKGEVLNQWTAEWWARWAAQQE